MSRIEKIIADLWLSFLASLGELICPQVDAEQEETNNTEDEAFRLWDDIGGEG